MRYPLLLQLLATLRQACKTLTPEARRRVSGFVRSKQCGHAYLNAGGCPDAYYTQFGVLCSLSLGDYALWKFLYLLRHRGRIRLGRAHQTETMYSLFFDFLHKDLHCKQQATKDLSLRMERYRCREGGYANDPTRPMPNTNATCCALCMLWQREGRQDQASVEWLKGMQHESGGFLAQAEASVPDLLSTAVALFTLHLLGASPSREAENFIDAHWMENGGFMPTLADTYSDVEYVFYGLLAIGSL